MDFKWIGIGLLAYFVLKSSGTDLFGGLFGGSTGAAGAGTGSGTGTQPPGSGAGATTTTAAWKLAGPVSANVNNALTADVTINGVTANLSILPDGRVFGTDGTDITAHVTGVGVSPAAILAAMHAAYNPASAGGGSTQSTNTNPSQAAIQNLRDSLVAAAGANPATDDIGRTRAQWNSLLTGYIAPAATPLAGNASDNMTAMQYVLARQASGIGLQGIQRNALMPTTAAGLSGIGRTIDMQRRSGGGGSKWTM